MSQEKFLENIKNNNSQEQKKDVGLGAKAAAWLSKEWKKSAILMGTGALSLTSIANTKDINKTADEVFLNNKNQITNNQDTIKVKDHYMLKDGKLILVQSDRFNVRPEKKDTTIAKPTQEKIEEKKKEKPSTKKNTLKKVEIHNKNNEAGFGDREQEYFNSAKQGEIQDRKLIREDIPNKGIYSTRSELKEAISSHNVFYKEVEAGSGSHWDLTNKEKLEKGGHLYNSEEEINNEKILNPKTGEMVPKHNPKQVDLKINGKFYPVVLLKNEYIAPAPKDMIALEDVVGGRGYVVWEKGTLAVFGTRVNSKGVECITPKWQYACGNPVMDNEIIDK